jgi:hypothetical protein
MTTTRVRTGQAADRQATAGFHVQEGAAYLAETSDVRSFVIDLA